MVARSGESLEGSGETNANLRTKMNKRLSVVKGHYKLVDCAHFHYDHVDFGSIQLQLVRDAESWTSLGCSAKDMVYMIQVTCQGKSWMVRRSYEELGTLDAHLHQCIYDRRYSQLLPLPTLAHIDTVQVLSLLSEYLTRLSVIVDNKLNCGPVLTWLEIDNHGNRFLLKEEASLNVPAIAAAHVIKRYTAQASDEISIEVGDILSVIDMPPKEDTSWWRGKHGFQVGFFPSECVELINEKLHQSVSTDPDPSTGSPGPASPTSVSRRHGKLLGFLRTFIKSRPSKQKLKQRGILKERVFGCDLGEHLLNSGLDVPQVLVSCSDFLELHGVVDGIYRHSGVSSNIQKLRHEFDSEMVPDLTKEVYMQDIHCVGSLCKLYFRELPNPLLTYQLYDKFADCMGDMTDDDRMVKVHDVIQQLPPPHYRTLEFLIRHLSRLATCSTETNMHIKNLAIVWAPNLLRSKEIETAGLVGSDPFREVRVQSVVVEFLLSHVDVLFSDSFISVGKFTQGGQSLSRPKSFVSTRLLSLEEAQARSQAPQLLQGAPAHLRQSQYHTVLDIQDNRRKRGLKGRKMAGSWKMFFAIGKPTRKPMRISTLFQPTTSHAGCRVDSVTLRSAKSEESLSSQHSGAGVQRLRRPRSSSDGLSLAAAMETQPLPHHPSSRLPSSRSYDSLLLGDQRHCEEEEEDEDGEDEEDEDEEGVYMLPDFSTNQEPASSWMAEDVIDFSPTFLEDGPIGLGSTRDSPPTGSPPAYHCHSHQAQRPITEDPDSVLNQSEAVARRSLILAATAPPQQVFCQHRPSNSSPAQTEAANQSPSHGVGLPTERRSFTKKVVHALSPKAPKSPPLDISQPIAISVPAKVLEMIGRGAGESQPPAPGISAPPPQMISMLLRSCDFQLSDSCQQELHSKLGTSCLTTSHAPGAGKGIPGPTGAPLPPQQPPLPPPKNPARLMALALAEDANRALRHQGASPPYRPPQTSPDNKGDSEPRYQRSLSADAGELLNSDANQLYSTVSQRPLAVWRNNSNTDTNRTQTQVDHETVPTPTKSTTTAPVPPSLNDRNYQGDGIVQPDSSTSSPIPDLWSDKMWKERQANYPWLDCKDGKFGCKVCSAITKLSVFKSRGQRLAAEWTNYEITHSGTVKAAMLLSLGKKVCSHHTSAAHCQAERIVNEAKKQRIEKSTDTMLVSELTHNVFKAVSFLAEEDRPFSDSVKMLDLLEETGCDTGFSLHSRESAGNITKHIGAEMRQQLCKHIKSIEGKISVLIDESTTLGDKTTLIVYLKAENDMHLDPEFLFLDLIELPNQKAETIMHHLLKCLSEHGFDDAYLKKHLVAFASDGASVMLGRKAGIAAKLSELYPNILTWHDCLNHRLELADTGTLSSETSVSDSVASDLSGGSSSGDDHSPSPVYTNQSQNSRRSPSQSTRKKPPAYGRQLSAPPLQQKAPPPQQKAPPLQQKAPNTMNPTTPAVTTASVSVSTQNISTSSQPLPSYPHLQHSRSESSPLSMVQVFQPGRPKVPPKPLDLVPPHRDQRERHLMAKSDLRRSLDSGRIRRLIGQPASQPPLARAFSERLSGAPDHLARYHAARAASQPVCFPPPPAQAEEEERGDRMENFYYEIGAPEPDGPPSYARHSYLNMRLDLEGNLRPAPCPHPDARVYQGYQGGACGREGQLWSSEATRAWAATHSMRSHDNRPHPQRHPCSAVRLTARSEMHPLPSSSFSPLVPPNPSSYPFPPPPLKGGPARSSDSAQSSHPAPLHPYFENGRVCYRSQPDDTNAHTNTYTLPQTNQPQASQCHDRQPSKNQSEPIYVNYPFTTSSSSRGWATSDLDPPLDSSPLSPLLLTPPEEQGDLPSPPSPTPPTTEPQPAPSHSPSHPHGGLGLGEEVDGLSGQDIAALLMERMLEEDPTTHSSSSSSSSSPHIHPPNPYASPSTLPQPPPPSSSSHRSSFQRGEVLRRSSSGGGHFYRQAFDVLPSGDQLLRFHRSPPPYPPQRSSYPSHPHPAPSPSASLANLSLGAPSGFYPPRREQAPEGPPLQGQRGLVRQGSLPGASWSQTRSYC